MKRFVAAAAFALLAAPALTASVWADEAPKTLTLTVTADELNALGQGLDLLPYGKVAPIIAKLHQQVVEQMRPGGSEQMRPAEAKETAKSLPESK